MKRKRQLVEVQAKGTRIGLLLQLLHSANIRLYRVRITKETLHFVLERRYINALRKANRKAKLKLRLRYMERFAFWRKSTTHTGLFLLWIIPLFCAQWIWSVQIDEATPEVQRDMEEVISNTLPYPLLKKTAISDNELRQALMANDAKLAWVHIERQGSKMTIRPLMAPEITEQPKTEQLSHLVATNGGVITHFELERGVRVVQANMTVQPGDILVSGIVMYGEEAHIVGAAGAVYADYWLETSFTFPRHLTVTTQQSIDWQLNTKPDENSIQSTQLFRLPIYVNRIPTWATHEVELNEASLETIIKPLLHLKILRTLPQKSTIKSEKILHVTFDDDTVKGKVLFLINENIATPDPIPQGE